MLNELLEIARWTGSSRNTQPWEFIVITDRDHLRQISQVRTPINWVADAPLAIAIVLDGENPLSEAFDEGRVTERLLIGARTARSWRRHGLVWGRRSAGRRRSRSWVSRAERTARSVVVLGYPTTTKDHRPNPATAGRRPLAELVSHERLRSGRRILIEAQRVLRHRHLPAYRQA